MMSEEQPPVPSGAEEQREQPKVEIWLVDDMESLKGLWKEVAGMAGVSFQYFEKGEEAVRELERRIAAGADLPHGIFMDGNLNKDQKDFNRGAKVIAKIRSVTAGSRQVYILAHSNDAEENGHMEKAGADVVVGKLAKVADIKNAMERIKQRAMPKE